VHRSQIARVAWSAHASPSGEREDPSRVIGLRASFLVRLKAGREVGSVDIDRLAHVPTLIAVLRAGSLPQRRAAASRLAALLDDKSLNAQAIEQLASELPAMRTFAIAYEVGQVTARLPGQAGREAQVAEKQWTALLGRIEHALPAFWDGEQTDEPLGALSAEERGLLLSRVRDLPDEVVRHISAVVTSVDGALDARDRLSLLVALQSAGDPRLVPALRMLIESVEGDRLMPAVRALARIDDPRVHPILKGAFTRTAIAEHRLVLAGALGIAGDARGLPYAREALATRDERVMPYALEALAYLGSAEDVLAVVEQLEHPDPERVRAAVETLGRIGDGRALLPLSRLFADDARTSAAGVPISAALRADAEEADAAIRARLELLGEEPPEAASASRSFNTAKMAALVRRRRDPTIVQIRARWNVAIARLWLALGMTTRAIARLEAAAIMQPEWAGPVVAIASQRARMGEHAQALTSFRRALEIDRSAVERSSHAIALAAQAFLRRAETVATDGRADVARGLLEEALALDLRKAPSELRFALSERLTALKLAATL
jgi:tetratricopeptide (TPR) repeat protein